jgi:hypothetical protein
MDMGILLFQYVADNVYLFVVIYKILSMFVENMLDSFIKESFLMCPFSITIELTENLITMGASSFTDFALSNFILLSVCIAERLYIEPGKNFISLEMPKWKYILHKKFRRRKKLTREQKAAEEEEWKELCKESEEDMAGTENIMDSFIGYVAETTAFILILVVNIFLYVYYEDTKVANRFGIRKTDLRFYILYCIFIIPAQFVFDVFIWNTQELVHGWKLYEYLTYQNHRFRTREHMWLLKSTAYDESLEKYVQSVDLMCFSSQFYFLITLMSMGILSLMFGLTIFLRTGHNLFGHILTPFIVVIIFSVGEICRYSAIKLASKTSLWNSRN